MPPEVFLTAFAMVCTVPVLITGMVLLYRHASQRRVSSNAADSGELLRRLERIEQTVDSTAIEVERLAESNRFVAKLLTEKSETPR